VRFDPNEARCLDGLFEGPEDGAGSRVTVVDTLLSIYRWLAAYIANRPGQAPTPPQAVLAPEAGAHDDPLVLVNTNLRFFRLSTIRNVLLEQFGRG